jgi:hypothetical protein
VRKNEKKKRQEQYSMAQLQVVYPLRPGTQEHWRRLCQTLAGSRREQFDASCRQANVTQVQIWLVQTLRGELMLMTLDVREPQQALRELAISKRPFERWLREQVQTLLGWNLQHERLGPQYDLIFDWSSNN